MVKPDVREHLKKNKMKTRFEDRGVHIVIMDPSRTKKIKTLLGDNFIGTRRCRGKLELVTKNPLTAKELKSVEKIWRRESDGE